MKKLIEAIKGSKKAMIGIGVGAVAIVAAVIAIIVANKPDAYRSAEVNAFEGAVSVERKSSFLEVFGGMRLQAEDYASTEAGASMDILVDQDKHIFMEENTKVYVKTYGNPEKGNVTVELTIGRCLFSIENKLMDDDSFIVNTPNASISVRGTKFYVTYIPDTTTVEVLEGVVEVTDKIHGTVSMINPGDVIIISPDDVETTEEDDTTNGSIKEGTTGEDNLTVEDGNGTDDSANGDDEDEANPDAEVTENSDTETGGQDNELDTLLCSHVEKDEHMVLQKNKTVAATCDTDGKKVYVCDFCGEAIEFVVKATGHDYEQTITPATCLVDGSDVTVCKNCGDETVIVLTATGHDYVETVVKAVTCTADGKNSYTCANCGDTYVETVKQTGHHYITKSITESTCKEEGVTTYECDKCKNIVTEKASKIGHIYEDGKCKMCGTEEPKETASGGGGNGYCSAYNNYLASNSNRVYSYTREGYHYFSEKNPTPGASNGPVLQPCSDPEHCAAK